MTSPRPVALTKEDRRAAAGTKARAEAEAKRADLRERSDLRKQPVPPGVYLGRVDKKVAALRLTAGRVALQTERDGPWRPLDVTGVRRGGWLWTRARLTLADGSHKRVCVYHPGEQGLADVGQRDTGDGFGMPSLGNDPISGVIGLIFLLIYLIALPFITFWMLRHARAAGRFIRALSGS